MINRFWAASFAARSWYLLSALCDLSCETSWQRSIFLSHSRLLGADDQMLTNAGLRYFLFMLHSYHKRQIATPNITVYENHPFRWWAERAYIILFQTTKEQTNESRGGVYNLFKRTINGLENTINHFAPIRFGRRVLPQRCVIFQYSLHQQLTMPIKVYVRGSIA